MSNPLLDVCSLLYGFMNLLDLLQEKNIQTSFKDWFLFTGFPFSTLLCNWYKILICIFKGLRSFLQLPPLTQVYFDLVFLCFW